MKGKACSPLTSAARPCRNMTFAFKKKQGGDVFTSVCWWLVNQEDQTKLQDRLFVNLENEPRQNLNFGMDPDQNRSL